MGDGIRAAARISPEHAAAIDNFKDQLLIVVMKRLKKLGDELVFPIAEVDDTASDLLAFAIRDGAFWFELRKKD